MTRVYDKEDVNWNYETNRIIETMIKLRYCNDETEAMSLINRLSNGLRRIAEDKLVEIGKAKLGDKFDVGEMRDSFVRAQGGL